MVPLISAMPLGCSGGCLELCSAVPTPLQSPDHWVGIYFQLLRTMNAFLNSKGGRVYFGVDDGGLVKCALLAVLHVPLPIS